MAPVDETPVVAPIASDTQEGDAAVAAPKPRRARRKASAEGEVAAEAVVDPAATDDAAPKPRRRARAKAEIAAEAPSVVVDMVVPEAEPEPVLDAAAGQLVEPVAAEAAPAIEADAIEADEESGPPRRGWWQRTFGD